MKKNIVAIVGRPNVGKSTLFNRICRSRSAIVDFESGITRDRKYSETEWAGKNFVLVDTGGIVFDSKDKIDELIRIQTEIAIEEADAIVFLLDVQTGLTDLDLQIAKMLSNHRDKVIVAVNKVDNQKLELDSYDFYSLGYGEPFAISATHGRKIGDFLDVVTEKITGYCIDEEKTTDSIMVSIVGKPNVGKSSIVNRLIGENTVIVSDIPGTTRDSIDSYLTYFGEKITLIDTAGLRKKKSIRYGVEYFSTMRTIESIDRSDIVLHILDAEHKVTEQDQKIVSYAVRHNKNVILVINKWDLLEKDNSTAKEYLNNIKDELPFASHCPIVFISALTNLRVRKLLEKIIEVNKESNRRISTSNLNDFLSIIRKKYAPFHTSGKQVKILYCTQTNVNPPTFVFFCNNPKLISKNYQKYIQNKIREYYKFSGVAVKLIFKGKEKDG